MLNNNGPRYKRSKLERQMNVDVFWCVIILLVMCLFAAVGVYLFQSYVYTCECWNASGRVEKFQFKKPSFAGFIQNKR